MPRLKSAVNSFLLTKKRLKRRRTNKRKRTNRRYKRGMRGGGLSDNRYEELYLQKKTIYDADLDDINKLPLIKRIMTEKDEKTELTDEQFTIRFTELKTMPIEQLEKLIKRPPLPPRPTVSALGKKPENKVVTTLEAYDLNGNITSKFVSV